MSDHTMFVKHSKDGETTLFIVYVDDIVITEDDQEDTEWVRRLLPKEFEVKDLGNLRYFLGMEIAQSRNGISVSQRKYTLNLLRETSMLGCKPVVTPMDPARKGRGEEESSPTNKDRCQNLMEKLIYLTHTRPNITFTLTMASCFMNNPTEYYMKTVNRILQYLKGTSGRGLHFGKHSNRGIEVFTDANWAGSVTDRKSTIGYCSYV